MPDQPKPTKADPPATWAYRDADVLKILEPIPPVPSLLWYVVRQWTWLGSCSLAFAFIYGGALLAGVGIDLPKQIDATFEKRMPRPDTFLGCLSGLAVLAFLFVALLGLVAVVDVVWALGIVAAIPGAHFVQVLTTSSLVARTAVCGALVFAGFGMYLFRQHLRGAYATVELFAGVAALWAGLGRLDGEHVASFATLAGGIYLVVRGFDNLIEGYKADKNAREVQAAAEADGPKASV